MIGILGVLEAIEFATVKHDGQVRKITGEPYICHPVRVAGLAEYFIQPGQLNKSHIIIAAILHDTLEDTDTTYDEIKNKGLDVN